MGGWFPIACTNLEFMMNKRPQVSVVMPCFNCENYIEEAIESIMNQTLQNFELIIVDDNSGDNSLTIIERYLGDERVHLIRHHENLGISHSLNDGIRATRAEFIARMDADDISDTNRLKKQVDTIRKDSEIAVLGTGIKVINQSGDLVCYYSNPTEDSGIRKAFSITMPIWPGSQMWRKSMLLQSGLFDERVFVAGDMELLLRLCLVGKARNLASPLYIYRRHDSGISFGSRRNATSQSALVRKVFVLKQQHDQEGLKILYAAHADDFSISQVHKKALCPIENRYHYFLTIGLESLIYGNRIGARMNMNKAKEIHPIFLSTIILSTLVMIPPFIVSLLHKTYRLVKKYWYIVYSGNVSKYLDQKSFE